MSLTRIFIYIFLKSICLESQVTASREIIGYENKINLKNLKPKMKTS